MKSGTEEAELTLSQYGIIRNINVNLKLIDSSVKFHAKILDNLIIETSTLFTRQNFLELLSDSIKAEHTPNDVVLAKKIVPNNTELYFCHIPNETKSRSDFEKFIKDFTFSKTFKVSAFIAEKVFSIRCSDQDDLIRIMTFLPHIVFEGNKHIMVADSWFDLPIIRFSNLEQSIPSESFRDLLDSIIMKDYESDESNQKKYNPIEFFQYQKNKNAKNSKSNIANLVLKTYEDAIRIQKIFNFSHIGDSLVYVNWFVDPTKLEMLEKYRVKVKLPNEMEELDFFNEMKQYGDVFRTSLDSDKKTIGNVVFKNFGDIENLKNHYQFEYCFANAMVYNFPNGTTEDDVKEYLSPFSDQIQSVSFKNKQSTPQNLPFFYISLKTIQGLQNMCEYIEQTPFASKKFEKIKVQPFAIPTERNLNATMQKYENKKNEFSHSNSIIINGFPIEITANQVLELCSNRGTIKFFSMNKKKESYEVNVTFQNSSETQKAMNDLNNAVIGGKKILVKSNEPEVKHEPVEPKPKKHKPKKDINDVNGKPPPSWKKREPPLERNAQSNNSRPNIQNRGRGGNNRGNKIEHRGNRAYGRGNIRGGVRRGSRGNSRGRGRINISYGGGNHLGNSFIFGSSNFEDSDNYYHDFLDDFDGDDFDDY
ncbi:hypothetical protein TRFO_09203 [Tritrichomonas foetus]|uniref:RRM domain-containing protein n=1 Tax=Tritrichomonas foetus TaxID=1144522 RepID=A0A1J4JF18_9EUKA|nr:hypothetical protein TRFO_09203 [Tritrichomonas foetus]|eukprot:OHS97790.1 hypothetical protein TRFO_09203 [Tritrichomonas foetus]